MDTLCQEKKASEGGIKNAFGLWLEIAAGWYANLVSPFGTIIDTNWLGKRPGDEFKGFMWSKNLIGICQDANDPVIKGPKYWTDSLNENFKGMTKHVYMEDNKTDLVQPQNLMKEANRTKVEL